MGTDVQMAGQSETVIAHTSASSGLEYKLHPLVLINISDHCMRIKVTEGHADYPRIIGCLFGQHNGRSVDITNSFEMVEIVADGSRTFDTSSFETKLEQYKQIFRTLDVIGWYATGNSLHSHDIELHKRIMEVTEAPVFLLMDPARACNPSTKDLPVSLYESAVHVVDGSPELLFVRASFVVDTTAAERIGVNTAASILPSGGGGENSALAQHYTGLQSALHMLAERVEHIVDYLRRMQAGEVPYNHKVMRMASGLLLKLPTMSSQQFSSEMMTEFTDASMINMMCMITKGVHMCNGLVDNSTLAYDIRHTKK